MKKTTKKTLTKEVAKTITYTDLLIHCSGDYLCENLPENLSFLKRKDVLEFISENIYEPFEYQRSADVYDLIDNSAEALATFLTSKGIEIVR